MKKSIVEAQQRQSGIGDSERAQARPDASRARAREVLSRVNLGPADSRYLSLLYGQYKSAAPASQLRIGENFWPSALLSDAERRDWLAVTHYDELVRRAEVFEEAARNARLTLNPLNGGIGSSIERGSYLRELWEELGDLVHPEPGAKGSDLHFCVRLDGAAGKVSISEAKLLRALAERERYGGLEIEMLASSDTLPSIERLLDRVNVYGRLGVASRYGRRTYRELLSVPGGVSWLGTRVQAALPTVDESGNLTEERLAPGGHGYWGMILLREMIEHPAKQPGVRVRAIYNEDGLNNSIDPLMVGWVAKERVAAVMLTTTKTRLDRKGGQIGVARQAEGGVPRKEILERATAEAAGQTQLFEDMGLGEGERGGQYFNTNTLLLNETVIGALLRELSELLGAARLEEILCPSLILNRKQADGREFIQLEGALGSVLMNLDAFLCGSDDPRVRAALERHGMIDAEGRVRFLRILNISEERRPEFFTPVKNAFDFWLQYYSDLFELDVERWRLRPRRSALPEVSLSKHYADVNCVLRRFGEDPDRAKNARVSQLDSIEVKGPFRFAGLKLSGRLQFTNDSTRECDLPAASRHPVLGRDAEGGELRNMALHADEHGIKAVWRWLASDEPSAEA